MPHNADKTGPAALAVFFVFCVLFAAQKICSYDVWWHLKTGEWIWQHKAVPRADFFSYTFQGTEWIDFEWLFQAVMYPLYELGGFDALIIFKIFLIVLTFVFVFLSCREEDRGTRLLTVSVLFLVLLTARIRFLVRPELVFLCLLAMYAYLLMLYRQRRIGLSRLIMVLVPAHVLWANFHSSFPMGIILVALYGLGRFIPLACAHRRDLVPAFRDEQFRGLFIVGCLLLGASLCTPYTYRVFLVHFKHAGATEILRGIVEWEPVDIRFLGLLALDSTAWLRAMFLIGAVSFLVKRDNLKRIDDLLVFAFFAYLAFKHIRFSGAFAILAGPMIVQNMSAFDRESRVWRWIWLVPMVALVMVSARDARGLVRLERLGLGVWRVYPEATVKFLKEHPVRGPIFNSYGLGGVVIWELFPDIPVFIDGRTATIYDEDFFWLYKQAETNREVWNKVCERYGITMVLLMDTRESGYPKLANWLDDDPEWKPVAFDDNSVLYLKKASGFDSLIDRFGFGYVRPSSVSMEYVKIHRGDDRYLGPLERELRDACCRFPRDFYPFYYLAVVCETYGTREKLCEAERVMRQGIDNRPYFPRGYYELGFILMKLERYEESVRALRTAIDLRRELPPDAYYYLGVSLYHSGDVDGAVEVLERYRDRMGPSTRAEAFSLLGKAYLKRMNFRKALSCFLRESYIDGGTWETLANMGIAHFGLDNLEQARGLLEKAMKLKPDSLHVVYNLAVVFEKLGDQEQAVELFQKASRFTPASAEEAAWISRAQEKVK